MTGRQILMVAMLLAASVGMTVAMTTPKAGSATTKDAEAQKKDDIRKLLELTQAGKLGTQVMDAMMASFTKAMPDVPAEFWAEFRKEVNADDLVEMVVPIYAKYLTHEDIKGIIEFYQSPAGKKLIAVQPKIMEESMKAGQQWGEKLGARVVQKLQERKKKAGTDF